MNQNWTGSEIHPRCVISAPPWNNLPPTLGTTALQQFKYESVGASIHLLDTSTWVTEVSRKDMKTTWRKQKN